MSALKEWEEILPILLKPKMKCFSPKKKLKRNKIVTITNSTFFKIIIIIIIIIIK